MAESLVDFLFGVTPKTKIGLVTIDAAVTVTHKKANEITKHPVEEGTDISDHIRHTPDSITVEGAVTNDPIVLLASLRAKSPVDSGFLDANPDRAKQADEEFVRAMNDGDIMTVVTSLRTYENMVITEYTVTRDKGTGNILSFTIALEEIVIVNTEQVAAPTPKNPANGSVTDEGKKKTEAASNPDSAGFQIIVGNPARLPGQPGSVP